MHCGVVSAPGWGFFQCFLKAPFPWKWACTVLCCCYAICQLHCCEHVRLDSNNPIKINCLTVCTTDMNDSCEWMHVSFSVFGRITDLHEEERNAVVCLCGAGDDWEWDEESSVVMKRCRLNTFSTEWTHLHICLINTLVFYIVPKVLIIIWCFNHTDTDFYGTYPTFLLKY